MNKRGNTNGNGTDSPTNSESYTAAHSGRAEPVVFKGFAVSYDRTFNLGDHEFLNPAATIWVKTIVLDGEAFDLHHARERVRRMARENVRAQLLRWWGKDEVVFLGLQPPKDGRDDPVLVESVSVSLVQTVNLANLNSLTLGFTDWLDEAVVDWQDDTTVAAAVEQFLGRVNGLFPVKDDIWDADPSAGSGQVLEVLEWRLYEIPVIPMGYDIDYDDDWEDLKEPAAYLLYMSHYQYNAGGFVRHEEFPERYPDHQVSEGLNPIRLVAILREGVSERLAAIEQNQQLDANLLSPEPLDALPDLIEMLHQNTGNAWLDVGEMSLAEGGGYPVWNQENVEWLAEEWQRAESVWGGINRLLDWLNSSPEAVAEKLTAVREVLLAAYAQTQAETEQPEPEVTV